MIIFFIVPAVITGFQTVGGNGKTDISQVITDIKADKVSKVAIDTNKLIVSYKDGTTKISTKEETQNFSELLKDSGIDPSKVQTTIVDQSLTKAFGDIAGIILPLILMVAFFLFIMKAQNKGAQDIFLSVEAGQNFLPKVNKTSPLPMLPEWMMPKKNWKNLSTF